MLDPYKMVVVNVLMLALSCIFFTLYRYVYPKKKIPPLAFVIVFSILPIISVFRKGVYESGDFNLQLYRAIDFYNSLSHGIILPRWGALLNASYGHPIFMFAAPFPYYVICFFHWLGFSFIGSIKALLITAYITSGITMFYFVRKEYGEKAGVAAAIFYQYAPYHFVDLHFRVSIGDSLAFAFYPLAFLLGVRILKEKKLLDVILLSCVIALLIISHPITFPAIGFMIAYFLFYIVINKIPLRNVLWFFFSIFNGLLLCAFYWYPLITEAKYTIDGTMLHLVSFTPLTELLYAPWRYGLLYQGPNGELSLLVGYAQFLVAGIGAYFIYKKKKYKKIVPVLSFLIISLVGIMFMITKESEIFWKYLPFINSMQFSYRLVFILVFITAFIAGIVLKQVKSQLIFLCILFFAVSVTILNWGTREVIPTIGDDALIANVPYATYQGEGATPSLTIWRGWPENKKPWMNEIPKKRLEIVNGEGIVKELSYSPIKTEYHIIANTNLTLKRTLFYFPGWNVYRNGEKIDIDYKKTGLVYFSVPKGDQTIKIVFEDTFERKVAKYLTFLGISVIFLLFIRIFSQKILKNH